MDRNHCFAQLRTLKLAAAKKGRSLKLRAILSRSGHQPEVRLLERPEKPADIVEVSLPALYGRFGALPDYFTDELLEGGDSSKALRDFLDIFNHRMLTTFQDIWERYHFFTEDVLNPNTDKASQEALILDRLTGMLTSEGLKANDRALRWHEMQLFRHPVRTRAGLLELLRSYFSGLQIAYQGFQVHLRDIPEGQRIKLGFKNSCLGEDLLCGDSLEDPGAGLRITFHSLDFQTYMSLQPGGERHRALCRLLAIYTESRWKCHLTLGLRSDQIPSINLGQTGVLGIDGFCSGEPPIADLEAIPGQMHAYEMRIDGGQLELGQAV
jgi:type VI secretion system protein ImpH